MRPRRFSGVRHGPKQDSIAAEGAPTMSSASSGILELDWRAFITLVSDLELFRSNLSRMTQPSTSSHFASIHG